MGVTPVDGTNVYAGTITVTFNVIMSSEGLGYLIALNGDLANNDGVDRAYFTVEIGQTLTPLQAGVVTIPATQIIDAGAVIPNHLITITTPVETTDPATLKLGINWSLGPAFAATPAPPLPTASWLRFVPLYMFMTPNAPLKAVGGNIPAVTYSPAYVPPTPPP
jgi:hypothetical protein